MKLQTNKNISLFKFASSSNKDKDNQVLNAGAV